MERRICVDNWRGWLTAGWVVFQLGDVLTTYWGLSYPTIIEANPLMAKFIGIPLCVVLLKAALTVAVIALLPKLERRTRHSSLPLLAALNVWMLLVCLNNSFLIVQASGMNLASIAGAAFRGS